MGGILSIDKVDRLLLTLTYSRVLGQPAYEVFRLEARPRPAPGRFDEAPYLDVIDRLLHGHEEASDAWTVHVTRAHRSGSPGSAEVEIAVALATGLDPTRGRAADENVRASFRGVLELVGEPAPSGLSHEEALTEARVSVEHADPEIYADSLAVTDEEHLASEGMWSVGLVRSIPTRTRFRVLLGFVDGDPRTTHVRRLAGSEVVDSVGTGGNG